MKEIIKQHPSILFAKDVEEICKPLETLTIDYFCHVNVDDTGNFTALGKNPKFVAHYLDQGYHNADVHLSDGALCEEYVIQDQVQHFGATQKLFQDCAEFKLNHIFTILQRNENSIDAFHFACSQKNSLINEAYLKNIDFLKLFIQHFKDKAFTDKNLKKAFMLPISIDYSGEGYQSDAYYSRNITKQLDAMNFNKFYLKDKNKTYLTRREIETILWLHHGKTADEIACILKITERTVRAHIEHIKTKLKCYTLFQLGEKIAELEIVKYIKKIDDY